MKKLLALILALLLVLTACAVETPPETTSPTTEPTAQPTTEPAVEPTTAPATEPTTAPTEPPEPETPWLTAIPEAQSYDAYFSEVRIFTHSANLYVNRWKVNEDGSAGMIPSDYEPDQGYALVLDDEGFLIVTFANDEWLPGWISGSRTGRGLQWNADRNPLKIIWEVPGSESLTDIDCYITDGRYAYCVRSQNQILRLDLLTGDTETLFTAESIPVSSKDCICLHDQSVLVFLSQTGDKISVNRLYLPTMALDVLYDEINADAFVGNFYLSYDDTDALLWGIMDPAFIPRLTDILSDPDSDYRKYAVAPNRIWGVTDLAQIVDQQDFITIVQMIEILEETPSLLSCYLDIPSGTYEETPSYWCPDMQEPRGYQDMSHWWSVFARFADPEQTEPVTGQELADAFDKSPFSFIFTLSKDGPWNESREDIVRQLVAAKAGDADTFIEVLREELRYYRTAASKAQPVALLTQAILDECLRQTGQAE